MELRDFGTIAAICMALMSLATAGASIVYAWAVLRTEVNHHDGQLEQVWSHVNNSMIHYNAAAFLEFEKRINIQLDVLTHKIEEVRSYCEEIDQKLDAELLRKQR